MHAAAAIVLITATLIAPQPCPERVERAVHLLLAVPPGERLIEDEAAAGQRATEAAMAFWVERSPVPTALTLADTQTITTTADAYRDTAYYRRFEVWGQPDVYVMIVDNSQSRVVFAEGAAGFADAGYGFAAAVFYGYPGQDALAATIAHELGHVLYGLPDRPGACADDVMCSPAPTAAYHARFVGCGSLAALGVPCRRIYLPMLVRSV